MYNEYSNKQACGEKICETKVYNTMTLPECQSENMLAKKYDGKLVAKVPILIAEPKIQIDLVSEIRLDEPAIEIKRIKKNLYLTQCKLLNMEDSKRGKLFISGFVRKNIEYATVIGKSPINYSLCGDIRHTTVRIPFECVTMVEFICPPEFCDNGFTKEVEIFTDRIGECQPCEERIMGKNPCEQEFKHFECFSEKVFCELVEAKIFEQDIRRNPVMLWSQMPSEQLFDCFTEKMVIYVRLKVLQNQQIKMPKTDNYCRRRRY